MFSYRHVFVVVVLMETTFNRMFSSCDNVVSKGETKQQKQMDINREPTFNIQRQFEHMTVEGAAAAAVAASKVPDNNETLLCWVCGCLCVSGSSSRMVTWSVCLKDAHFIVER